MDESYKYVIYSDNGKLNITKDGSIMHTFKQDVCMMVYDYANLVNALQSKNANQSSCRRFKCRSRSIHLPHVS